ncbi:MAG: adenine-specific DNA-methyltransferase [Prevotellaceae bacterium]|jgi:site-specific DNA-methyltransferase (adenine-specific)|nr:adenine-specific DNA-methyltransferase [Prevotellaceae bacterium]
MVEKFENKSHTIIKGDSIETLSSEISDSSIDLIFVDPPYNIGKNFNGHKDKWASDEAYLNWSYRWIDLCINKLKSNGSLYIMTSTQFMPYFDIYIRKRLTILSRLIWFYDSSGVQAKRYYGSMYEPILFCVKDPDNYIFNSQDILVEAKTGAKRKLIDYRKNPPQIYSSEKVPGNVWEFARVRYRMDEYENHPTQKPVALLERIIKASSNEGDTVLDPFSGTFTTSFVAKQLSRKSIGIELQEEYIKIGLRRLGLATEYKGEKLKKEVRSFENERKEFQNATLLNLFES